MKLTRLQRDVVRAKRDDKTLLRGFAGTGKTTTGLERLRHWLDGGIPPDQIFVMLPQLTLAAPYHDLLTAPDGPAGGIATVTTLGGIARRAVDLFWPLVAAEYGFGLPERRPTFLSLETAQYFMARVAGPLIDRDGLFDAVTIDRNRLYSQIIDNLNKAAVIDGFEYTAIADRLKSAWAGSVDQSRMYDDVQTCANLFRDYCKAHNLLDFSLQIEVFKRLWELDNVRDWVFRPARYVLADNIEEDTPLAHKVLAEIVERAEGALLIYDDEAGYRQFLGADDRHALRILPPLCKRTVTLEKSHVTGTDLTAFGAAMAHGLGRPAPKTSGDARAAIGYDAYRYHPEMIDGVVEIVAHLIHGEGVPPSEVVIIAPYLSDALRFSLMNRLTVAEVPVRSHRPSRSLREEPAAQTLLTLTQIAHPDWSVVPTTFDVAYAFVQTIEGIDLVRAQLIARECFQSSDGRPTLRPFEAIRPQIQERITFIIGERYDHLRAWLDAYINGEPLDLDHFLSRLFGEVLSQPGFGFHDAETIPNKDAATVAANLIASAQKFRTMIAQSGATVTDKSIGQEYVEMVAGGIIADQYISGWQNVHDTDSVLVAPAYTYLLSNRPVDYQFWLNVGGSGWSERLYQPLTNPHVLSLDWPVGSIWTDDDETRVTAEALYRLVLGLIRRCRKHIYLGFSDLGEQGYEQRGDLLTAFQRVLRDLST